MNTGAILQIKSINLEKLLEFAAQLGKNCKGGEVFELISDLGGGKTTFVRGLAKGLGSKDLVSSPTFMVEKVYEGRLPLHHFDFYRLSEAGVVGEELREVLGDMNVVTAIEWGEIVHDVLPANRITIRLNKTHDDNTRDLDITVPTERKYLVGLPRPEDEL